MLEPSSAARPLSQGRGIGVMKSHSIKHSAGESGSQCSSSELNRALKPSSTPISSWLRAFLAIAAGVGHNGFNFQRQRLGNDFLFSHACFQSFGGQRLDHPTMKAKRRMAVAERKKKDANRWLVNVFLFFTLLFLAHALFFR